MRSQAGENLKEKCNEKLLQKPKWFAITVHCAVSRINLIGDAFQSIAKLQIIGNCMPDGQMDRSLLSRACTTHFCNRCAARKKFPNLFPRGLKYTSFSKKYHNDFSRMINNKANLRDLIAATGLVISNWIQMVNFAARVTCEIWWMTSKNNRGSFYTTSSFVHHFKFIGEFKLDLH